MSRTFPRLPDILSNTLSPGEAFATIGRVMNFRVTARDNRGGYAYDTLKVTIPDFVGSFIVKAPGGGVTWVAGTRQIIRWDVANTSRAPVSCMGVTILLSTDGGNTYPNVLAASTSNDGSEVITVPNIATSGARIKIEAIGNVFFNISNSNFTIALKP
ncbi:MAG: hypothetical protein WBV94_15065 [Blastocatellia bacterium]